MKILKTYGWLRRDFYFDAKCENCEKDLTGCSGYDDSNYYNNVIPQWKCPACGMCSNNISEHETVVPRYNEHLIM